MQYIKSITEIDYSRLPKDSYLRKLSWINNFQRINFEKPITFFVGENGTGKSTLLEAIAISLGFNAEGGSKNFNFSTNNTHSVLGDIIKISKGFIYPKDGFFF